MNLRVASDGTVFGTTVQAEDGRDIKGISALAFEHKGGSLPKVVVTVDAPFMTGLMGSGEFSMIHPVTGDVKVVHSITFADGEVIDLKPQS